MATPVNYNVVFVTPDEKYYCKPIPEPCQHYQEAEYHSRKVKPKDPKDKYVTVSCDEDEFL